MSNKNFRAFALGLMASTAIANPAFAQDVPPSDSPAPGTNATDVTAPPAATQASQDGLSQDSTEIIVTAQKREENLQDVPISIQALGSRRLDQLNIQNFEDYTKQLPSVSFQTAQPGVTVVYMRGVASGGDGNHSGSLPSVGTYLDEQPVTTIGGTLDVHIYDVARIESLAGPQGTLYGASSQAGTIRIITNKPDPDRFEGRVDGEINQVLHGGVGGTLEGMVNVPLWSSAAFRGSAFYRKDAGYIDNIFGSRTYYSFASAIDDITVTNAGLEEKDFNDQKVYGGRAALKVDLDDNWTVTPSVFYQKLKANGVFFYDPELGDLNIDRFRDEYRKDKFWQAALTVQGKLANFDVTYAGAYLDRKTASLADYTDYADAYDVLYSQSAYAFPGYEGLGYFAFYDSAGDYMDPRQYIDGSDHFTKMSHEIRVASPAENPVRVIAGAFYQRQTNHIYQNYLVDNLAPELSVNGLPETLWLTDQRRIDRDYAVFGEVSWDITPQLTLTGGGRLFKFDNSLFGFFGFGRNPGDGGDGPFSATPPNAAWSSRTGVAQCFTQSGERLFSGGSGGVYASNRTLITSDNYGVGPCVNLADYVNGELVAKRKKGDGFTHRLNAQYKPQENLMFYATWSRGFRPGGINRRGTVEPYEADYLSNWEVGWKTTLGPFRWNGALYHQIWKDFQYSFLGANSFTEIHNANDAKINGIETDVNYVGGGWTINAAAAYTDAKTSGGDVCGFTGPAEDCSDPGNFVSVPNGTRLPVTPRFKMSATARYSWPVLANARAHVQGGVAYQSSAASTLRTALLQVGTFEVVNPRDYMGRIKSSAVYDFSAGIDWQRFNIEAFVLNLFDRRNELSRGVSCGSCFRTLVVSGTPTTVGLRAGMKF